MSIGPKCSDLEKKYKKLINGDVEPGERQSEFAETIASLRDLQEDVDFSDVLPSKKAAEELADVHTHALRFVAVQYMLGDLLQQQPLMDELDRLDARKGGMMALRKFAGLCERIKLVSSEQLDRVLAMTPITDRMERLRDLKRQEEVEEKFTQWEEKRSRLLKLKGEDATNTEEADDDGEWEETEREYQKYRLEHYFTQTASHLRFLKQEIEMLSQSEAVKAGQRAEYKSKQEEAKRNPQENIFIGPGQLEDVLEKKKEILGNVFKPYNPPTMTMQEFMQLHPEEFTPTHQEPEKGSDDEDEDQDNEEKVQKQRAWDDWKEDHPRGWGNRNKNVG